MMAEAIMIWRFYEAPDEFQALSPHGGDEDFVALIPAALATFYPSFLEPGASSFGRCDVSEHLQDDGRLVLIGAHA